MAVLRFYSKVAILSICLVGTVWAGDDVEQPMPEVVGPINAEINKLYGTDIQVPGQ